MPATARRRLLLRVATKMLGLIALTAFGFVALSSLLRDPAPEAAGLALALDPIRKEHLVRTEWNGHRLLILHREPDLVASLTPLDRALADPQSRNSEQPDGVDPRHRAADAAFFVALDYDPDFGCPLEYRPASDMAPVAPWVGGFRSPCSGSWFDPAGRVYQGQRTTHNLRVPPHRVAAGRLHLTE